MKKLIYPLASLLGLCACSQQTDFLPAEQRGEEIVLNGNIGEVTTDVTRTPIESTHATALDVAVVRTDQTSASTWTAWKDSPTLQAQRAATNGTAAITFKSGSEQYYTTGQANNGIRLCAWYPFQAMTSSGVVSFTLDGKTDVMYTDVVEGSATDKFSNANKVFNFKHAQVRFTVKAYGDAAGYANWGNITEVKFLDVNTSMSLNLANNMSLGFGTPASLFLKSVTTDADITGVAISYSAATTTADAVTCGYLLTGTNKNNDRASYDIQVTTVKGGVRTVNVKPTSGQFVAGTHYTVYLHFQSSTVAPYATVTAWTTSSDTPTGTFPNP